MPATVDGTAAQGKGGRGATVQSPTHNDVKNLVPDEMCEPESRNTRSTVLISFRTAYSATWFLFPPFAFKRVSSRRRRYFAAMWPEEGTEERDIMDRDISGPVLLDRRQVGRRGGVGDSSRSMRNRTEHVE